MHLADTAGATAPRFDIYLPIHKGLRAFMCHLLPRVGCLDTDDETAVAQVLESLGVLLRLCASHLRKEDSLVHPALEARMPGATAQVADDHRSHGVSLDILEAQAALMARSRGHARAASALRLYRLLAVMVGESLVHMHQEETELNAALWRTHGDDELRALEARIVSTLGPEEAVVGMRWILQALSPAERLAFLQPIRDQAPPEVLADILEGVRPHLSVADWGKLEQGLRKAA
ncbi:MAG: hemerythrin domain-containing protein [Rhodocyclaceae bacterium]|jgi:hypothetical protein|nr:hemerythrin domain-containing protein [Rhodocyclaceae bacterium]